jgi:uncharacterized protein (DUF849 family)
MEKHMTPIIITTAITGAIPRKKDNPAVPVTPNEQIESTHAAYEAGSALVHIHVRDRTKIRPLLPSCLQKCRRACGSTARE